MGRGCVSRPGVAARLRSLLDKHQAGKTLTAAELAVKRGGCWISRNTSPCNGCGNGWSPDRLAGFG